MRYTDMLLKVRKDHPAWSPKMCVIAARYHLGIESTEDLEAHTQLQHIFGGRRLRPLLTNSEANAILRSKP